MVHQKETVPIHFVEDPNVGFGWGVFQHEEDGDVLEQDACLAPEEATKAEAIKGLCARIHNDSLGFRPDVVRQCLQGIQYMDESMTVPLHGHPKPFDEVFMARNDQQVHGEPLRVHHGSADPWRFMKKIAE